MAKKHPVNVKNNADQAPVPRAISPWQSRVFIALLLLIPAIFLYKIAFMGYVPATASDTTQWRGSAQPLIDYEDQHNQTALWDANIFAGMPGYLINFSKAWPYLDDVRKVLNPILNWRVLFMFLAGLGVYVLLRWLGYGAGVSFFGGIAFGLSCHFFGLIDIGHNTKFRAIAYMGWLLFALLYLRKNLNLTGVGLLSLFMIAQLRESHPQISYYFVLFMGLYWLYQLVVAAKAKNWRQFGIFTGLLALTAVIVTLAIANPYMSIREYGHYSIRGGEAGLDYGYATSWSFHPAEIFSLIAPDFFGGTGNTYWGWMPFTQTYHYMGIGVLFFAIYALIAAKNLPANQKQLVRVLGIACLVALVFSFGRHFEPLTKLLLNWLPGWNKFRVPATILVLVQLFVPVLAGIGFGLMLKQKSSGKMAKGLVITMAVIIGIMLIFAITGSGKGSFSFMSERELSMVNPQGKAELMPQNNPNLAQQLQQYGIPLQQRAKLMAQSVPAALGMLLAFVAFCWLYTKNHIPKSVFIALVIGLTLFDLIRIDNRYLTQLKKPDVAQAVLKENAVDKYLEADSTLYRILPVQEFSSNRWVARHQSIGGYHGAKLQRYEDFLQSAFTQPNGGRDYAKPTNPLLLPMLGVKYLVSNKPVQVNGYDQAYKTRSYQVYKGQAKRAWFVNQTVVEPNTQARLARLTSANFNPFTTALTEEQINNISAPDSSLVNVTSWDLHNLSMKAYTSQQALLVISEVYYPAGWQAYIDNKPATIYPVNHILRGVVVPAGNHTVSMRFTPTSYSLSIWLSLVGILASLGLLLPGVLKIIKRKNNE